MISFSKLYRNNREISPKAIRDGAAVLLAGRCPRCGKHLARVAHHMPYLDPDWEFADTPITPLPCCVPVWPTEVILTVNGNAVTRGPLAKLVSQDAGALLGEVNWMLVLLDHTEPRSVSFLPRTSGLSEEWLLQMARVLEKAKAWPQDALQLAFRIGKLVREKNLWPELWLLALAVLRTAKDDPGTPLLTLYRCIYRAATGGGCVIALQGGRPLAAELFGPNKPTLVEEPLRLAWPWDVAAFTFGMWDPESARKKKDALAVVFRADFNGEGPLGHWEEIRARRRYTLTPAGVRAVLREGSVKSVFLKEIAPTVVFFEFELPGLPEGAVRGWFDWEEGSAFSPWMLTNGFHFDRDPVVGLASLLYCDLVTAEPRRIAAKTGRRVRVAGESRGKAGPRVVYVGDPQKRGAGSVRVPLERRPPREHAVAGHLRRVKGSPSADALRLAEQFRISVPDGFTFVRPHTRGRKN